MRGRNKKPAGLGSAENEPGIEISLDDIKQTTGEYDPKDIVLICDELGELMNSDDFQAVSSIKEALGSIARLGRAAGFHLVLATQKATSGVINSELMNNIHQSVVLGDFDSGVSTSMFEKDISYKSKPEIKGRGFSKSGKEITEFQAYWTTEKDFKFVEMTLFERLAKSKGLDPDAIKAKVPGENEEEEAPNTARARPGGTAKSAYAGRAQSQGEPERKSFFDKPFEQPQQTEKAATAVAEKLEGNAPERTVSRKSALDENGEIDYNQFL